MQIKKLTDAKTLFKLEQENFSDYYSIENCVQELINPLKTYYIAIEDNNVIGYIGVMVMLDEAEILRVAVTSTERNRGVAKQLLSFVIEELKLKKVKKIFLEVSDKNKIAYNFYIKNKFEIINTRKNYYSDNSNAIIMQRGL